jgi:hypothetical protein
MQSKKSQRTTKKTGRYSSARGLPTLLHRLKLVSYSTPRDEFDREKSVLSIHRSEISDRKVESVTSNQAEIRQNPLKSSVQPPNYPKTLSDSDSWRTGSHKLSRLSERKTTK